MTTTDLKSKNLATPVATDIIVASGARAHAALDVKLEYDDIAKDVENWSRTESNNQAQTFWLRNLTHELELAFGMERFFCPGCCFSSLTGDWTDKNGSEQ